MVFSSVCDVHIGRRRKHSRCRAGSLKPHVSQWHLRKPAGTVKSQNESPSQCRRRSAARLCNCVRLMVLAASHSTSWASPAAPPTSCLYCFCIGFLGGLSFGCQKLGWSKNIKLQRLWNTGLLRGKTDNSIVHWMILAEDIWKWRAWGLSMHRQWEFEAMGLSEPSINPHLGYFTPLPNAYDALHVNRRTIQRSEDTPSLWDRLNMWQQT